jgi:hypothetical protein
MPPLTRAARAACVVFIMGAWLHLDSRCVLHAVCELVVGADSTLREEADTHVP